MCHLPPICEGGSGLRLPGWVLREGEASCDADHVSSVVKASVAERDLVKSSETAEQTLKRMN